MPLIVWFAEKTWFVYPTADGAVKVKLLNVFAPVIVLTIDVVDDVKLKL